jgi:hypothetical protein
MLPLLKFPVALMRTLMSLTRVGVAGEMLILVRFPPVVLRVIDWLTPPPSGLVALIVVVPCVSALIVPSVTIVAMAVLEELQVTLEVTSKVELSV